MALAKVLTEFAKDDAGAASSRPAWSTVSAIAAEARSRSIATLPSREELIAKLLFLLQSPITRFVRVLAAVPQSFVVVLDQVRKSRRQQAPKAATEPIPGIVEQRSGRSSPQRQGG